MTNLFCLQGVYRVSVFIGGDDKTLSINPQVNTNFQNGGEPEIKAIGIGDLSAGCKFTSTTYGMIIGIYRAIPQLIILMLVLIEICLKQMPPIFLFLNWILSVCKLSIDVGYCLGIAPPPAACSIDMSVTYGYSPRYAELKSARDYYEGGFCGKSVVFETLTIVTGKQIGRAHV